MAVINRDYGAAEQFAAEMKAITDNYRTYLMDLNDTDDIAPIVEDVVKTYGHIDGLVNNAGRNDNLDLDHTSWREFEQSLHGNLTRYYELAHRCAPYLRESKGAIVNISSKTALTGQGKTGAYAANLLVFDASKGVHFHDEVFKDTVYFMNNVFCNTSTTPTQWYRKTDALAKAAFSNNDYYEPAARLRTPSLRTSVVWKSTRSSSASPALRHPGRQARRHGAEAKANLDKAYTSSKLRVGLDSVKAGVQWAPTMSEIQVHNGSGSASSHKPAVAVVNSNFNKQAPETLPEYTVTLDGDKLQSIRWIGSEGNVLSSLDEGDYTVSGEGDKVTVKIAADFLKGKDAGNYGLQFEFASVAPPQGVAERDRRGSRAKQADDSGQAGR